MALRNDMASSLLGAATIQTVADVMFASASNLRNDFPPPSLGVARKFINGSLAHAVIIAGSVATDPEVLAEFAKDTRVAVREALLQNPATPTATVEKLTGWAIERKNPNVITVVVNRIDPERVVLAIEKHVKKLNEDSVYGFGPAGAGEAIAVKVDNNGPLTHRLLALNIPWISQRICSRIGQGASNAVNLVDALSEYGGPYAWLTAQAACRDANVLTRDLATIAAAYDFYWDVHEAVEQFTTIEDGSLQILAGGRLDKFETALMLGLDELLILERIKMEQAKTNENKFVGYVRAVANQATAGLCFSQSFETKLVESLVVGPAVPAPAPAAEVSVRILNGLRHALPCELMLAWLQSQSSTFALAWLAQTPGPNSPKPGELTKLLNQPGNAFVAHPRGGPSVGATSIRQDESGFLLRAIKKIGATGDNAQYACPDVISALDPYLGSRLRYSEAAAIAMPVLERTFGSQALAWETLLTLAPDWQESLTDLIGATLDLSGCTDLSKATLATPTAVEQNQPKPELAFA